MSQSPTAARPCTDTPRPSPAVQALTWRDAVWLCAIIVVGVNLRPLLSSISPLMAAIREATGLSFYGASLLTSLPVVAMGIGAFGAGALTRTVGETRGVALGLLAIGLACAARWTAETGAMLLFTATLAGMGVAAIQALLPGVIKQRFGTRVPLVMGVFSASMMAGGGLGAGLSPWIAQLAGSWHAALAVWAFPALVALICWLCLNRQRPAGPTSLASPACPSSASLHDLPQPSVSLVRNRRAWALGLHFGLVNGGYTSLVAWLPAYYLQHGADVATGGSLLAGMTVFQAAAALLLPLAAASFRDRRPWLVAGLAAQLAGIVGLSAWPGAAPLLWVALMGAGLGGTFALTLVTTLDHAGDHRLAARLVAFVQGVGFVIAAAAPMLTGFIRDLTGTFTAAWIMLAVTISAMIALTFVFSPRSYARALAPSAAGQTLLQIRHKFRHTPHNYL